MLLADPLPRAQGAPGRHDRGHRRRRAVATRRSAAPEDLDALVEMNAGLDGRPDIALRLGLGRVATSTGSTAGSRQRRVADRQLRAADRRDRLGGRRRRRARTLADMRALLREAMEEGAFGSRPGSTTRPAPTPRPTSWQQLTARRHARRLLPHPRALRARRPLPGPVPRGDRDRPARRGAGPHHPLLSPPTFPGGPEPMLGAHRRRPRRGPGRHLRHLSIRVGDHPAPDPDAALGPGRWPEAAKERLADQAVRDRLRRELAERGALYAGRAAWADVRLGAFTRPEHCAGRAARSAIMVRDRDTTRRHALRPAARGEPPRQPGHARPVDRDAAPLRPAPGRDGRHRFDLRRREAVARGPTARSRGSSASSSATRRS